MKKSGNSVRGALALSFAGRATSVGIAVVSTMILARLLTPAEIGIYSVGVAAVGIAHGLRDFGVGNYLIQEKELTRDRIRSAFTITLLFAWPVGALLFVLSEPLGTFYKEPGVSEVLKVVALSFLVLPFGSPAMALLRREMNYVALYQIVIAARFSTAATSVTLAALGFGFISLAWGSVAGAAITSMGGMLVRRSDALAWPTLREWRRVFAFGARSSGATVITEVGNSATDLILGRTLGFAAVGLFSRGQGLIRLFNQNVMSVMGSVAFPAFAARERSGGDVKALYLRACGLLTGIAWPPLAFVAVMAAPIIRVMFGDQWDAAIPLLRILAMAAMIQHSLPVVGSMLMSVGRVDLVLRSETLIQAARIGFILLAALHSLEAVAVTQVLTSSLYVLIYSRCLHQLHSFSLGQILRVSGRSALLTVCAMIGPVVVGLEFGFEPESPWLPLLLASVVFGFGWLAGVFLLNHPLKSEIELGFNRARGIVLARGT